MRVFVNITAAILAGGLGTRLRSVVADRQKVLADVHGRPFLTYLLDQVADTGISDVVLCTGYRGEQVKAMLGETYHGLHLTYSQEPEPLGTGGALRYALPLLMSDPVLVMNGDSCYQADLRRFLRWHQSSGAKASLLLTEVPDTRRYGWVEVDREGRIVRFDEKDHAGGPGWVNAGLYLISRSLLQSIPATRMVSLEREVFPSWIGRGLYGCCSHGRFEHIYRAGSAKRDGGLPGSSAGSARRRTSPPVMSRISKHGNGSYASSKTSLRKVSRS